MGHHEDRDAEVLVEAAEQFHHLAGGLGVEVAGRFVGEQRTGIGDDGAGDRDALLLAAGELGRRVAFLVGKADAGERFASHFVALLSGVAAVEQGQLDVFQGGGAG